MAWTIPKTWASEPLTSTDLNTYVRDNQNALRDRQENNTFYTADEASDYTTTSTSFVDVDGANDEFTLTLTTTGGKVLVGVACSVTNSGSGEEGPFFNIAVDGADHFADDGVVVTENPNGLSGQARNGSFVCIIDGLTSASHTFTLRWKTRQNGNTATLYAGAGTSNKDVHPQFWVQEL